MHTATTLVYLATCRLFSFARFIVAVTVACALVRWSAGSSGGGTFLHYYYCCCYCYSYSYLRTVVRFLARMVISRFVSRSAAQSGRQMMIPDQASEPSTTLHI